MKKSILALLATFAVLVMAGCNNDETVDLIPENFFDWTRTTQETLNYPIPGHGESMRYIYINQTGIESVQQTGSTSDLNFSDGSILVKTVHTSSDSPEGENIRSITAMVKDSGNQEAIDGWIWIMVNPSTGKENITQSNTCVVCHETANDLNAFGDGNPEGVYRDYVFIPGPWQ